MRNINFMSFANELYSSNLQRLKKEAEIINIFNNIITYTDKDLIDDPIFWNKHSDFILNNYRGYGYWIWKPYLTLKTLEIMNENDILVYCDAGCELNSEGINRLNEYINIVENNEYANISFELSHKEKSWTKMDIFNFFNININDNNDIDKYVNSKQLIAGIFILKKCKLTSFIIEEWYRIACNYNLINDTPSILPNDESFIENRHDQSIFSLLRKKYGTITINDETNRHIWSYDEYKKFPIYRRFT
jgi:hypothetical protein